MFIELTDNLACCLYVNTDRLSVITTRYVGDGAFASSLWLDGKEFEVAESPEDILVKIGTAKENNAVIKILGENE